jgi:DNA-binding LacI/PurR family transcriptional regulator/DNA-binding transcriptional regulator YhcF (GntR family)
MSALPKIIADLESQIRSSTPPSFGTTVELARRYGVSYATMGKAIAALAKKGLIESRRGTGVRIVNALRSKGPDSDWDTSQKRLLDTIRSRLQSGEYQVGRQAPKMHFFVVSEKVSFTTVSEAFKRLASEGLMHKEGKRWLWGPHPVSPVRLRGNQVPVCIAAISGMSWWNAYFSMPFCNLFTLPFKTEMDAHGIKIEPASVDIIDQPGEFIPGGINEVDRMAAALGDKYLGAIAMTVFPRESHLREFLDRLSRRKKPVLFFDSADKGPFISRQQLAHPRSYYRLHLDETAAVQLALSELTKRGHRVIGIHGSESADWAQRRAGKIEHIAKSIPGSPRIIRAEQAEHYWGFLTPAETPGMHATLVNILRTESMSRHPGDKESGTRELLISHTGSFARLLQQGVTAIISLNDYMAREHYYWCKTAGLRVPEDISIISFDKVPESVLFPVSTIDFGFSRLGYLAAHAIIGDIPIYADRLGNMPGRYTLVDRGSLGVPAREHL